MKAFPLMLSLTVALAALPAVAQDNGSPQKQIKLEIGAQDADLGLALVALDNGTIPLLGDWILANATVIVLEKQDDGSFACFADLPMQCDADLWWQGVTWGAAEGLKIHPVEKLAADLAVVADEVVDGAAKPGPKQQEPIAPLPIELSFLPADDGSPGSVLEAKLIAPTNDYNLVLVRVDADDAYAAADSGAGKADVYLYRKVPGEGEGMLDVIEEHTVTVDLYAAKEIRVFLATGKESRPGVATAWRFLTKLAR